LEWSGKPVVTKRTLEDSWREVSRCLDEVLDLEAPQRQAWLEALRGRDPKLANLIGSYLTELAELDQQYFLETDPAALLHASTLAGERFGAYTLDKVIGHGGMGTVWLAHRSDGRFEGQVAVKLLNAALIGHPSAQRFVREGQVLAKLQHAHIAHLLDAGVAANSQPYLVLQYIRGESIDQYCDRHNLDVEPRIRLFLDVLAAVAHAHSHLVIHRDLKPTNILVSEDGIVKLLDFGVAALLSADATDATQLTRHVAVGLTPGYAAPEQLRGENVTTATDIYALGLILFVLLAGRHPWLDRGNAPRELMRLTLERDAPRLSDSAVDPDRQRRLRGDLDNILGMALHRNPDERYQSVELFAQDLRHCLAMEPVSARPLSVGYLAGMFIRRHRAAVAAAAAIFVVLLGAVTITTAELLEARDQRDHARFQSRRVEATNEFLGQLLLSDHGPKSAATNYRERIDAAVERLERQYRNAPKFRGRMLVYFADVYGTAQENRRANELLERAHEIGREDNDPELMAYALCDRVLSDTSAGITEGTTQRLTEAQQLLRRTDHAGADVQAACLVAQSAEAADLGDFAGAEKLSLQAKQVIEEDGSEYRQIYGEILSQLSNLYLAADRPQDMLRTIELVGRIQDSNGRDHTSERMWTHENAATALVTMGEIRGALGELRVSNQGMLELSDSGVLPIPSRINYASALGRMGRFDEAMKTIDVAIEEARSAGSPGALARGLLVKANMLLQLKRWEQAEIVIREVTSPDLGGASGQYVSTLVESYTMFLDSARQDWSSAHRRRDRALQLAGYHRTTSPVTQARVLQMAAAAALAEHDTANAEQFAKEALVLFEGLARGPDTSADVGEALMHLAQARMDEASKVEIRSLLTRAVRCLSNGLAPDHPLTLEARALLAAQT
jgi:eukaryotic-like serine/threonine-protein kinase